MPSSIGRLRTAALWVYVWVVARVLPVAVALVSLKRLLRLVSPPCWYRPYRGVPVPRIVGMVERSLRHPRLMRRHRCLRKALMLYHFLRLSGREAVLHLSVLAPSGKGEDLVAHCWVSLGPGELFDPPEVRAAELLRYPGAGSGGRNG